MFDDEAKLKILDVLESNNDPESRAAAELIRAMDAALAHLADALSCSVCQADGKRQPCTFQINNEECSCERCGQLVSEWALQAASALEYAFPGSLISEAEPDQFQPEIHLPDSSENLNARAEKVQALFGELEHVFSGLSLPARVAPPAPLASGPGSKCEGCGGIIPSKAKFCPQCGRTVQGRRCLGCNAVLDRDMNFCPACGAKAA